MQVTTGKKENSGIGSTNFVTLRTGAGVDYFLKYNLAIEALVDTSIFSTHSWQGTLLKLACGVILIIDEFDENHPHIALVFATMLASCPD